MMNAKHSGFTLVELVAVIVLIGILSVVALPRFFNDQSFTTYFEQSNFLNTLHWTRNRAITSQCAYEVRVDSTGWRLLRDDDRDGDQTDQDCARTVPGNGCAANEGFSFIYRNNDDLVQDGQGNALTGSEVTSASLQRLIFTADGQLHRLIVAPSNPAQGCTQLTSASLIGVNQSLTFDQINLIVDGATAYVSVP